MPRIQTPQPDLSSDTPGSVRDLRIVRSAQKPLSKAQEEFNRRLGDIRRLQNRLQAWQAFDDRHRQRFAAELLPVLVSMQLLRRDLILLCDDILAGRHDSGTPKKVERRQLTALLLELCGQFLEAAETADAEVMAIHDSYATTRLADVAAASVQDFRDDFRDAWGIDIPEDVAAADLEAYVAAAFARMQDEAASGGARRRRRAGDPRHAPSPAPEVDVKQLLREVYRKLASALHPDRGTDEADRHRRHALMQRANEAYAGADLLALFELQLEINQIDTDHITMLPETRLRQFNRLLKDQAAGLKSQIDAITNRFRSAMFTQPRSLTPETVDTDFALCVDGARQELGLLQEQWAVLPSAPMRKAWLKAREADRRATARDPDFEDGLTEEELEHIVGAMAFLQTGGTGQGRSRRANRTRRARR